MTRSPFLFSFLFLIFFKTCGQVSSSDSSQLKASKFSKRYINPKAVYLTATGGWALFTNYVKDDFNFFESKVLHNDGIYPTIGLEVGIMNNFFLEFGYDRTKQFLSVGRTYDGEKRWQTSVNFLNKKRSNNIYFGGGYRLIWKNNLHILNVHGGLYLGLSNKSKSDMNSFIGGVATYTEYEESINLSYTWSRTLESYSPLSFGAFLGVSKEIPLSQDVKFYAKYVQRFGFIPIYSGTYQAFSNNNEFTPISANFVSRSGGVFISVGLKILLSKNI